MTATLTPPSRIHGSAPVSREPATPSSATTMHTQSKLRSLLSMRELPVDRGPHCPGPVDVGNEPALSVRPGSA